MVTQEEALKTLNDNKENRKYNKEEAKQILEFLKFIADVTLLKINKTSGINDSKLKKP